MLLGARLAGRGAGDLDLHPARSWAAMQELPRRSYAIRRDVTELADWEPGKCCGHSPLGGDASASSAVLSGATTSGAVCVSTSDIARLSDAPLAWRERP